MKGARERLRTIEAALDEYDRLTLGMGSGAFAMPSAGKLANMRDLLCRARLDVEALLEDEPLATREQGER